MSFWSAHSCFVRLLSSSPRLLGSHSLIPAIPSASHYSLSAFISHVYRYPSHPSIKHPHRLFLVFSPLSMLSLSPYHPPPLYNNWKLRSACKQRVCSICLSEPGSLIQYDAFYLHLFSFKLHNFIFLSGSIMLCVPHFNIHPFVGGCFHSFAILKRTAINGGV